MAPIEVDLRGTPAADTSLSEVLRPWLLRTAAEALRHPTGRDCARLLKFVHAALTAGQFPEALRLIDRAWRCHAEDEAALAPVYGPLMLQSGSDDAAALRLLQHALTLAPNPDLAALGVLALLRLERPDDARREFEAALALYSVEPGGLLARAGGDLIAHPTIAAPGWLGRAADLDVVGELAPGEARLIELRLGDGAPFTQILTPAEDGRAFRFKSPQPAGAAHTAAALGAGSRGTLLVGSGVMPPVDFGLDGRLEGLRGNGREAHGHRAPGHRLTGWVRLGWAPRQPLCLRVEDEAGHRAEITAGEVPDVGGRRPFALRLRHTGLKGHRLHVSACLPDGTWRALPDSPLIMAPQLRAGGPARPLPRWTPNSVSTRVAARPLAPPKRARAVDVIIPVYRNRVETLACIDSVLATVGDRARLVIIDDASGDPELAAALDVLEAEGRLRLLRNAENLGFVASANRGLALHPTHDAILLNSDTQVFAGWLERLRAAAYSGPRVGTVTPLSNSGSIASYPNPAGGAMDAPTAAGLDALAAEALAGQRVEIPVGVGFCLYVRRDCLREVGELDAGVFGKGYGEETDFCLRARARGWSHQLAADVFVYHAEGQSFGSRRTALLERAQRLVNLRHPGYDRFIAGFLALDPLKAARRALDERRLAALEGRFVLVVTLALGGGVDRFVTERCQALRADGLIPLLLRPAAPGDRRRCELFTDAAELPNLRYHVERDLPALLALLNALPLAAIEIQHFLHLDARLIEAVRALPVPYDVYVHDYAWICPRVTLIDASHRYCGEPAVTVCEACVRRSGSQLGERLSVPKLRARSAAWLGAARRVVAPAADTARRLEKYFPTVSIEVQPHRHFVMPGGAARAPAGAVAGAAGAAGARRTPGTPLRVALLGGIGTHKGYRVLLDCARDARARDLPLEFVVIGHTENDARLMATGKVFVTGFYGEPEAPHLIERERPDIAWLPSVWPETWSYTLDHALGASLPVVAFDLGAIAERLRALEMGELLALTTAPAAINDRLLALGQPAPPVNLTERNFKAKPARNSIERRVSIPDDDASILPDIHSGMTMTSKTNGKYAQAMKDEGLSAAVQVLPLPPGLYLFSVKAGGGVPSSPSQLSLPAMHVGLGPGVRSDQVDFIASPSTHGAWLFSTGDLLVTKVNGAGATLVLTSVRAPGGDVLSVKVERLEDRVQESAAAAAPAQVAAAPARGKSANGNGAAAAAKKPGKTAPKAGDDKQPLPVQIGAHIRTRGDMQFADLAWAGRVGPGLWIEAFSVRPLAHFGAADIEYKGLTGSGFETPWLTDDKMCGTKGMATPLVGFAIRLKPSPAAAAYDCEYSGYFQSGITVGPLRNGAPCRSSVANDALEGIQVRLVKRAPVALPEVAPKGKAPEVRKAAATAPRGTVRTRPKAAAHRASHRTPSRTARSSARQSHRRP